MSTTDDAGAPTLFDVLRLQRDLLRELSTLVRSQGQTIRKLARANARMARGLKPSTPGEVDQ